MNRKNILSSLVLPVILSCTLLGYFGNTAHAQFPVCDSMVYFISNGAVYNLNTLLPISSTNPVLNTFPPPGGISLAVSENLNSTTGPSRTFYGVDNAGNYIYYDGTTWVNTGHSSGSVDIGAGGGYIYGKTGANIYRYDGTANATLVATLPSAVNVWDIAADCEGNFYVLDLGTTAVLRKYSPSGTFLYEWTVTGGPTTAICFSLSGNQLLVGSTPVYAGVVDPTATSISLTALGNIPAAIDFGGCPFMFSPPVVDTLYQCNATQSFTVTATGSAPYSASVLSGNATITGTGPNYTVLPSGLATVVLQSTSTGCGSGPITNDTFLLVPPPAIDAGTSDTLFGCGSYQDTLHAVLSNGQSWVTYQYSWTPVAGVVSGGATLDPVIAPAASTMYRLTLTTDADHGNCQMKDSVFVPIVNKTVVSDFSYRIVYGCDGDSVIFHNNTPGSDQWSWNFDDGHMSTVQHPAHFYDTQGYYTVVLATANNHCADSTLKTINTTHPLHAAFTVSRDTICQGDTFSVASTSTVFLQPGSCAWNFGDGTTAANCMQVHRYTEPGTYQIRLVASDSISCRDTAYHTVTVDSIPDLKMQLDRHSLCAGEAVVFRAAYTQQGLKGYTWNLGDGTYATDLNPVTHAYEKAGLYPVRLNVDYRVCKDLALHDSVVVHDFPEVYLGPDTTICLNSNPIYLKNLRTTEPGSRYLWNTGDTSTLLKVTHHGNYSLTVSNEHDCATTDEVVILKDCYTDIPNSFSPNGDGINDYFYPRQLLSSGVSQFSMTVFNRWGQVMFKTEAANGRGWDGRFNEKEQPVGVYVYQIQVTLKNGRSEHYEGNVTLIR